MILSLFTPFAYKLTYDKELPTSPKFHPPHDNREQMEELIERATLKADARTDHFLVREQIQRNVRKNKTLPKDMHLT